MAVISPFRGTQYNREVVGDLEGVVAPPYDVVTKTERDEYLKNNPYNIFALELPDVTQCEGVTEVADKYQCANHILRDWLKRQILISHKKPAIYPYEIEFHSEGNSFLRTGFICLVRADDWEKRTILPHEKTFKKVTEERFKLRQATRAQFSQIFMLYRHFADLSPILEDKRSKEPVFEIKDSAGSIHRLFQIDDKMALDELTNAFKDVSLYIADGHHRYTTSIEYRKVMEERYGLGPQAPYNFTMAYLVDASDPGLVVLPTHRVLTIPEGLDCAGMRQRLERYFFMKEIECSPVSEAEACVRTFKDTLGSGCSQGITVMFGKKRKAYMLCPREEALLELLNEVQHQELANLDVVLLEELVFKKALGINTGNLEIGKDIHFVPDSKRAVEHLNDNQVLFFMSPTKVEQVLDVADAGLCMPHKSTYFYPKILTGTVLCLEDEQLNGG